MSLAACHLAVLDENADGLLEGLDGYTVEVRSEGAGNPLVNVFSDRDGLVNLGNPFIWNGGPNLYFHTAGGALKVTITKVGHTTQVIRYKAVGTSQEFDASQLTDITSVPPVEVNAGATYDVTTETLIVVNKTIAGAITINLPAAADREDLPLIIKDLKGDAETNNITVHPATGETIDGIASDDVIDGNYMSRGYRPVTGGWVRT